MEGEKKRAEKEVAKVNGCENGVNKNLAIEIEDLMAENLWSDNPFFLFFILLVLRKAGRVWCSGAR